MTDKERCGAPIEGKGPCESPVGLCDDCGRCLSHCEHREEEAREVRSLGGQAKAEKDRRKVQLLSEELPPLDSHEAAQTWLDVVGRAVFTGRLGNRPANSVVRAVEAWCKAEAEREGAEALHELQERLEALESDNVRRIS